MIETYDYMTDEELIRHIYHAQNSTAMERLLAKRMEKCMDRHESASESVYVQATLATKAPECARSALDRILVLTAPPMGSQFVSAEGRAECDTRG